MKHSIHHSLQTLLLLFFTLPLYASTPLPPKVQRAEPLSWWTGMNCPLTLMLQGQNLADAEVTIKPAEGLTVTGQHNAESPNYLFVDLDVQKEGTYTITVKKGNKKSSFKYTINSRREGSRDRLSFTSADVIYLIMSDRFVDGDETNNTLPQCAEAANKDNIHGRWGGDIQGIINSFDHIRESGATAIWPTPLLCDNEAAWSYHGYACSDYYHIDPRYGTNDLYKEMIAQAHAKGIKVLMDMVPNHCGGTHWWMQDLPYHDWIHQFDSYTSTNNVFSANYDINASQYDRDLNNSGWFDRMMPDMNLSNPDLLQYFKQWAIWWIEFANLDGLRVDTYPYVDKLPAAEWCQAIRAEYPNINIVGECWTRPASNVAYWQADARNADGFNSNLPSVMDFPTEEAIRQALENDGNGWGAGMMRVYDAVAQDYLYADVNKLLLFVGNHDMDRFADIVKDNDLRRVKLGITMIATMRGIPQVFAGDEYAVRSSDMKMGHSGLRRPLPDYETLTAEQKDLYAYHCRMFKFRETEPIIWNGKTMHFAGRDNTYAYFRYTDEGAVFVYINASEEEREVPVSHYNEILGEYNPQGVNVMTGESIDLCPFTARQKPIKVAPLSALVVKLTK